LCRKKRKIYLMENPIKNKHGQYNKDLILIWTPHDKLLFLRNKHFDLSLLMSKSIQNMNITWSISRILTLLKAFSRKSIYWYSAPSYLNCFKLFYSLFKLGFIITFLEIWLKGNPQKQVGLLCFRLYFYPQLHFLIYLFM